MELSVDRRLEAKKWMASKMRCIYCGYKSIEYREEINSYVCTECDKELDR